MSTAITRRQFGSGLAGTFLLPRPSHAQQWNEIVEAARKEGEVVVHGGPGKAYADALIQGFSSLYPFINVKFTGGSTATIIPRIIRERKSDIYAWDVLVGGAPSALLALKPTGAFAPLKPYISAENLDDRIWLGGFDDGWLDNEKKYSYANDFTSESVVLVNWDFVSRDRFRTVEDIAKPEFAGKICWMDPRTSGEGVYGSQIFNLNFGLDFVTDLFIKQKIVYTGNGRQAAEWLVRGRYPISIGVTPAEMDAFTEQGLGKNVETFAVGLTKEIGGAGFGVLQVLDKAPHPNATKLYVNWYLSQMGQLDYAKSVKRNSRRLDVAPGNPRASAKFQTTHYVNAQSEEEANVRAMLQRVATERLGAIAQ